MADFRMKVSSNERLQLQRWAQREGISVSDLCKRIWDRHGLAIEERPVQQDGLAQEVSAASERALVVLAGLVRMRGRGV